MAVRARGSDRGPRPSTTRITLSVVGFVLAIANVAPVRGMLPASASATVAAAASDCPTIEFVGVRGSGEPPGFGREVDAIRAAVASGSHGVESFAIAYPAIPVNPFRGLPYLAEYRRSVNQGKNALTSFLNAFHTRCSTTSLVLVGYSQGAQIVGDIYQSIKKVIQNKIAAVAMLADPRFNPKQPVTGFHSGVDVGSYDPGLNGIWASRLFHGMVRTFTSNQYPAVHSYCLKFDPICNYSPANALNCFNRVPGYYCVHEHYIDFGYTADAANWILSRLPAASAPLELVSTELPNANQGLPYTDKLIAIGGNQPYVWQASGSALADGLSFDPATGVLSGTPVSAGQFGLDVTVSDSNGQAVSKSFTLLVNAVAAADDWPQLGHDAGQSNYNAGEQLLGADNVARLTNVPSIVSGLVYRHVSYGAVAVLTPAGYQFSISAHSLTGGAIIWSHVVSNNPDSVIIYAVGDGVLVYSASYFSGGVRSYTLEALNLVDGSISWASASGGSLCNCGRIALDGAYLIDTRTGNLRVLDPATGQQVWALGLHGNNIFATGGGMIMLATRVSDASGKLVEVLEALDESSGQLVWNIAGPSDGGDYSTVTVGGSSIFVTTYSGELDALDLQTGHLAWQISTGQLSGNIATDGQSVYASTAVLTDALSNTYVTTLHAYASGTELWHVQLPPDTFPTGNPVLANGVVYTTTSNINLSSPNSMARAFSAATGQVLWTSPPLDGDAALAVADGYLFMYSEVYGIN